MIPLKTDCRFFRGDVPCKPHKRFGVHCVDESGKTCPHYDPVTSHILIIKLGAIGDVIRTTPLLHKLKATYPSAKIWWLTLTPEILPATVDEPLAFSLKNIVALRSLHFDILYNLDKDREACALAEQISASTKRGFNLQKGIISAADGVAEEKYLTGIFDDVSQTNTKSYPQEIFEICGFTFAGEKVHSRPPDGNNGLEDQQTKEGRRTECWMRRQVDVPAVGRSELDRAGTHAEEEGV